MTRRRWIAAWLGGPVIGVANGAAREETYGRLVGERTAQRISTATAIVLFTGYFELLERRWPIPTRRTAFEIGAAWSALTIAFEFGFGHSVVGDSWEKLLRAYDVRRGETWVLVPLWMAAGPAAVSARRVNRAAAR
jgi:hypothetical protein